jgi:hypothetical protein
MAPNGKGRKGNSIFGEVDPGRGESQKAKVGENYRLADFAVEMVGCCRSSLRDLRFLTADPAMNRRAIVVQPPSGVHQSGASGAEVK